MSRKSSRGKRNKAKELESVPEEILAEGSGPSAAEADAEHELEGTAVHVAMEEEPALPAVEAAPAPEPVVEPRKPKKSRRKAVAEAEAAPEVEVEADDVDDEPAAAAEAELDDAAATAEPVADAAEALVIDLDAEAEDEAVGARLPTSAASMDNLQLKRLVEALVFASDKPLTLQRLRQLTRVNDTTRLEATLDELATDYVDRGLVLQQVSGGYQFRTRSEYSAWVQQLIEGRPVRLSRAQLETLAIVAYRQPITRPEIDDIRGVDSSNTLKVLVDRALIRILGKREEVGRPMLYGTTKEFLDFFSLGDLRELPTLREYSELTDESRRVMTDRLGANADLAPGTSALPDDDDDDGSSGGGSGGGGGGGGDGDLEPLPSEDESPDLGGTNMDDFVAAYIRAADTVDQSDLQADGDDPDAEPFGEPDDVEVSADREHLGTVEAVTLDASAFASDDDDESATPHEASEVDGAGAVEDVGLAAGSAPVRVEGATPTGDEDDGRGPDASGYIPAVRTVDESAEAGQGHADVTPPIAETQSSTDEGADTSLE